MGKGLGMNGLKNGSGNVTFSIVTVLSLGVWTRRVFISEHATHAWSSGRDRCGRIDPSAENDDVGNPGFCGVRLSGNGGVVEADGRRRDSHRSGGDGGSGENCGGGRFERESERERKFGWRVTQFGKRKADFGFEWRVASGWWRVTRNEQPETRYVA